MGRCAFLEGTSGVDHLLAYGEMNEAYARATEVSNKIAATGSTIGHHNEARAGLEKEIEDYSLEKRYIKKDGTAVWVNLTVSPGEKISGNDSRRETRVRSENIRECSLFQPNRRSHSSNNFTACIGN